MNHLRGRKKQKCKRRERVHLRSAETWWLRVMRERGEMKAESRDLPFSTHRWAAQPQRVTTTTVRTASSPSSPSSLSSSGSRQTWHARALHGVYGPGTCTRAISMWELRRWRRVCTHPLSYFLSVRWCCRKEEEEEVEEREYPIMPRCPSRPAGQMDGWMDRGTDGWTDRGADGEKDGAVCLFVVQSRLRCRRPHSSSRFRSF